VLSLAALAFLVVLGLRVAHTTSVTADEPGHLAAGLSYCERQDYRPSTENLFFTQRWAASGAYRAGTRLPDAATVASLDWNPSRIGEVLLFSGKADPVTLVEPARRMTLVLAVVAGLLVWGWAARLGGPWAGAFALVLYATSPVVLASATLVTTDMGTALWYVAAMAAYGWLLARPGIAPAAATGVAVALLALTKFTVAVWCVSALLLLLWHAGTRRSAAPWGRIALLHGLAVIVAWATIWSFFGWTFRPGAVGYPFPDVHSPLLGIAARLKAVKALPLPFLREVVYFGDIVQRRPGYLLGSFHDGGSWYFFPVTFQAKSTIAMLAALAALLIRPRLRIQASPAFAALAAAALGYTVCALASSVNIGVRHILPLFLLASVGGGLALARLLPGRALSHAFVICVVVLAGAEGLAGSRRPISFFNALWGGPMSGYRVLVDSSLEWGGDLPDLAAWVDRVRRAEPNVPIYVSLIGPQEVTHYGVPVADLGRALADGRVAPGYFVFGATRLVGGPEAHYGKWDAALAARWRSEGAGWPGPLPFETAQLGVARMAASLRDTPPSARVGPVYFVYRLDDAHLKAALDAPGARP
jgi:Dolichyl-phosphate-mannose-protein mannosyltransferase